MDILNTIVSVIIVEAAIVTGLTNVDHVWNVKQNYIKEDLHSIAI